MKTPNNIFDDSLLQESIDYGRFHHAEIVYRKCLIMGKMGLAEKIRKKYNLSTSQHDDTISAMGVALLGINKKIN